MGTLGPKTVLVRGGIALADGIEMPLSGRYCSAL